MLFFAALAGMLLGAGGIGKLADWWYKHFTEQEESPRLKRPLRVRKITRKEPLTARRAGTVYPDRKEVNEE